ncbi:DUF3488 and transglutaminase-like domain-containing protein [Salinispirillum sp. LH 10-3-1]|uniref:DUF3488 and transglutaminase-like domain-containing protein n=1 Tax=Salinispirillum sp. LH 10-3-1 TaxID=2952525 RepID=A0AB38YC42_9GAMM
MSDVTTVKLSTVQWQKVLLLLQGVQVMLAVPAFLLLPFWVVAVPLVSSFWQWGVLRGRLRTWSVWSKLLVILVLPVLLVLAGFRPTSLEFYIAVAYIGGALKLLEMKTYRDALLVVLMAIFLLACFFLLDQGMGYALYAALGSSVCLLALAAMHAPVGLRLLDGWRMTAQALLITAPFMVALFLLFPRLEPLWRMPLSSDVARTGISSTMSPGEISQLVQSDELVFRAQFVGDMPPPSALYWRVMTLDYYSGRRWYQSAERGDLPGRQNLQSSSALVAAQDAERWTYELTLAPTGQRWIPTLEHLLAGYSANAVRTGDQRLVWREDLKRADRLTAEAADAVVWPDQSSQRQSALHLPDTGNPRVRALAQEMHRASADDHDFAWQVMRLFAGEDFRYTLQPTAMAGNDSIDDFIFTQQAGFCAHYAEAFVFMLRAAGIPARVVVGYLGGQRSADGSYLRVRQREAHAWAEVWLDDAWQRFDPTAMVAPDRIEFQLDSSVAEAGALLRNNWFSEDRSPWIQQLYWHWDGVQYNWQRWVLNFSDQDQAGIWQRWLTHQSVTSVAVVTLFIFLALFGSWYIVLLVDKNKYKFGVRGLEYRARKYCQRRAPNLPDHQGFKLWVARLEAQDPELAAALSLFAAAYLPLVYGKKSGDPELQRLARFHLQHLERITRR